MKVPVSWLKDFVDIDLNLEELAKLMTMIGLEIDEIRLVGLAMPPGDRHEFKIYGLSWEPAKFVVAQINEVLPHPNADRLVLCRLDDGEQEIIVLTGAPDLYPYKGLGVLDKPLKAAYAREGAQLYDGHQPGNQLMTLKRTKIRGVESFSMVCSEKELGISDNHEGIILLEDDAPTGMALVDYMGDAVLEVAILPNMIRCASILGIAREIAACTGKPLKKPDNRVAMRGAGIEGQVSIEIRDADLNPRFVVGLIKGIKAQQSPYQIQRRLYLAGMRPINSIVDATNYVMLETGEPLHAFDYDVLVQRAGGKAPKIITRPAIPKEKLITLDRVERTLEDYTILVTDTAGALSLAGVMGGMDSEVTENTRNVLLEGATWNFINVRRTVSAQRLESEAAYRFARGLHPALAEEGVLSGLRRMVEWSGGEVASGLVDVYPQPLEDVIVSINPAEVKRLLGIDLSAADIASLLNKLEFETIIEGVTVQAKMPPHRMDISTDVLTGKADLMEEIARMYGYDRIPSSRIADSLPPQRANIRMEREEELRDKLVSLGLQEVVTYRLSSPEREKRILPAGSGQMELNYVKLQNPISADRVVMRRSLLASMLEIVERNARLSEKLEMFEIGPEFIPQPGQDLPEERLKLVIAMTGLRYKPAWDLSEVKNIDFFDLKGLLEDLFDSYHITNLTYEAVDHATFHPGKCAAISQDGINVGVFGEIHPLVVENYEFTNSPILIADLDLEVLFNIIQDQYEAKPVPVYPPVIEDIAVIVDENLPAVDVEKMIWDAGGKILVRVSLFDIFQSEQIGEGKKSLAYRLTYQSYEKTLTDEEASTIRNRIVRRLEKDLDAKLRG